MYIILITESQNENGETCNGTDYDESIEGKRFPTDNSHLRPPWVRFCPRSLNHID